MSVAGCQVAAPCHGFSHERLIIVTHSCCCEVTASDEKRPHGPYLASCRTAGGFSVCSQRTPAEKVKSPSQLNRIVIARCLLRNLLQVGLLMAASEKMAGWNQP
jgi:hypothetical protein